MLKRIANGLFLLKQKSILLKEKKRLEDELKIVRKFPQFGSSEEDNAQEVGTFEEYKGLESGMSALFKEVSAALTKIDKKNYGLCEVCKNPIERGRLEAFPAARTCIEHSGKRK